MASTTLGEAPAERVSEWFRWAQLILGIICMVMIANYQYGWTLFVPEIEKTFGWKRPAIAVAFTLFVLWETWLVPVEGWLVDKYGPRMVVFVSGLLCALGWFMTSRATSLEGLTGYYAAMIICGIGAGGVYGTCVGNALKWFPDKRGLAAGLTAAGFGIGSAFTVEPIQSMIKTRGFQETFLIYGLAQGAIICLLAFFLFSPKKGQVPALVTTGNNMQTRRQYGPNEIIGASNVAVMGTFILAALALSLFFLFGDTLGPDLKKWVPLCLVAGIILAGVVATVINGEPVFMLMYIMFVMVGAGGLIATANLASIAKDYKIAETPVTMGVTMAALTFALTIDRFLNGITRPFFGWVSDQIGRENTMFVAFLLEGVGIYLLYLYGKDPMMFVILTGLVFFAWGEIYSLFPSTCTDTFGSKFASANAGLLYTAKGTASLLGPYALIMQKDSVAALADKANVASTWDNVLIVAAAANILAAFLALFVLKPWRAAVIRRNQGDVESLGAAA
jgi:MFS transporter, OFA family, oxalate/formate antiporter